MSIRITQSTTTFMRHFSLASFDAAQPAETYRPVTEEEEIAGLSFPVFRRLTSTLHTPALSALGDLRQALPVDAAELGAALEADAHGSLSASA